MFVCCCFFNKTETFKNNKSINLLCRSNTSNLSAGLNNCHNNKNFKTKHCLFFHKCLSLFFRCCLLVAAMMAMKWLSLYFPRAVDCSHFRQILQSPPSTVWAAGDSYCPIFQAGLSVSFLSGLGCRQILLPHISGRFVNLLLLKHELQANLTAPYFRQICQLSLVHSS